MLGRTVGIDLAIRGEHVAQVFEDGRPLGKPIRFRLSARSLRRFVDTITAGLPEGTPVQAVMEPSTNTVHLMRIKMTSIGLKAGSGGWRGRRSGKLLILRLTPRGFRRWQRHALEGFRRGQPHGTESSCQGGTAPAAGSLRRTTRTAWRKESRSGSSSALSAASWIRLRMAKWAIIRP